MAQRKGIIGEHENLGRRRVIVNSLVWFPIWQGEWVDQAHMEGFQLYIVTQQILGLQ